MRTVCHNRTGIDYCARDARLDLENALREAWNTRNGKPQCSYDPSVQPRGKRCVSKK